MSAIYNYVYWRQSQEHSTSVSLVTVESCLGVILKTHLQPLVLKSSCVRQGWSRGHTVPQHCEHLERESDPISGLLIPSRGKVQWWEGQKKTYFYIVLFDFLVHGYFFCILLMPEDSMFCLFYIFSKKYIHRYEAWVHKLVIVHWVAQEWRLQHKCWQHKWYCHLCEMWTTSVIISLLCIPVF